MTSIHRLTARLQGPAARLYSRAQPIRRQAALRWRGLAPRERKQVLLMVVVLAGALIWLLFTKPALNTLRRWDSEMPRLRSQSAALQDVLAEVGGPKAAPGAQTSPPTERTAASLDQAGLAGNYRLSEVDGDLVVAFSEPVDAARLVTWLLDVPVALGLTVRQVSLERVGGNDAQTQDARVQAAVTLTQQPRNGT